MQTCLQVVEQPGQDDSGRLYVGIADDENLKGTSPLAAAAAAIKGSDAVRSALHSAPARDQSMESTELHEAPERTDGSARSSVPDAMHQAAACSSVGCCTHVSLRSCEGAAHSSGGGHTLLAPVQSRGRSSVMHRAQQSITDDAATALNFAADDLRTPAVGCDSCLPLPAEPSVGRKYGIHADAAAAHGSATQPAGCDHERSTIAGAADDSEGTEHERRTGSVLGPCLLPCSHNAAASARDSSDV